MLSDALEIWKLKQKNSYPLKKDANIKKQITRLNRIRMNLKQEEYLHID